MTNPQRPAAPIYSQPRVVLTWLVTAAWAGTISLLSTATFSGSVTGWLLAQLLLSLHIHVSAQTFVTIHFLIRKLAHCSEYAIFGLLLYYSFDPRNPRGCNSRIAFGALVCAGLFSLTDEYHQSLVPGRTPSLVDCGIDTAGALLALVLFMGVSAFTPSTAK